jgi:hypothetical protein
LTTQKAGERGREDVLGCEEASPKDDTTPSNARGITKDSEGIPFLNVEAVPDTDMYSVPTNSITVDLYCMDSKDERHKTVPFQYNIELHGPQGEIVRVKSTFDDGAMVNAIDLQWFGKIKHRLKTLRKSEYVLRMADGRLVASEGAWTGEVTVNNMSHEGTFQVFDSSGAWSALFGKPLLKKFKAVHDYEHDTIKIPKEDSWVTLKNQWEGDKQARSQLHVNPRRESANNSNFKGDKCIPPSRQVLLDKHPKQRVDAVEEIAVQEIAKKGRDAQETEQHSLWTVDTTANNVNEGTEQKILTNNFDKSLFTRKTKPFKDERVEAVLAEVTIGEDLDDKQRVSVVELIREFADCFALSLSEVTIVEGAAHKLNIPEGTTFKTKVHQRPLTGPQKEYFNGVLDKMLEAGIIEPIHHTNVKCCGATTLAKKAHEGDGLDIEELQHRLNEQCTETGRSIPFKDLPNRKMEQGSTLMEDKQAKWRVCQDFAELNRVTKVPPMPQGDIRTKQQRLSGHRWINTFDFAAGFYACEIEPENRPYVCFYVEGRGYFCYCRMPFGLTGGPSSFAGMTANALGDLVGTLCELFVDDGGMAGDNFQTMLDDTRKLLLRIREKGLSLSASKSSFFVTEAVFAGARVGPAGIRPDLTKLTAIVDWKRPKDLQNLAAFTGLTGYFRSLIRGYAAIAQPLTDLGRSLNIPKGKGKAAYRKAMRNHTLGDLWKEEHEEAFMQLKIALTNEPALKGPKYDGTPFIITTDGCKYGFAGMLSQRHVSVTPNGKEVTNIHPIAFCSKRTSETEEKYKPYLLEFAALKFTLDQFSNIIWGYPVEIETDCQALRDHLMNDKLNSTHARWRDGVLAHQIIDVRHRPGRLNPVADGISRKYVNLPTELNDGHEWTVSEDWEARTGIVNDIFQIESISTYNNLRTRFANEKAFLSVINALAELDHGRSIRERKKANHRAEGYMIQGGQLWKIGDAKSTRARPKVECIPQSEAIKMAWEVHRNHGHFHKDNVKIIMMDKIASPHLDKSINQAIMNCGKCKGHGPQHLHSLLEPITRRHPFELLVGDTLSMPKGKGGFTKISLYVDVYSQHVWAEKLKTNPTAATTCKTFNSICSKFTAPEALMVDGGPEFDNHTVRDACTARNVELRIVPGYSPWINGLVEGTNKILLGRLKRLCAPDLGEDELNTTDVPASWPDHLEAAVEAINNRILPHLKFSPTELLLGLVVNTGRTPTAQTEEEVSTDDVGIQMAYVEQQRMDGYDQIHSHADKRKLAFDRRLLSRAPKEVIFKAGQLVQVYRSDLDFTYKTERKMEPKWSAPRRVTSRDRNSYKLETLEGLPIGNRFAARRLRRFIPRSGTALHEVQAAVEELWGDREAEEDRVQEVVDDDEDPEWIEVEMS